MWKWSCTVIHQYQLNIIYGGIFWSCFDWSGCVSHLSFSLPGETPRRPRVSGHDVTPLTSSSLYLTVTALDWRESLCGCDRLCFSALSTVCVTRSSKDSSVVFWYPAWDESFLGLKYILWMYLTMQTWFHIAFWNEHILHCVSSGFYCMLNKHV